MSRDRHGRFVISDATIQVQAAAARMKACLDRDVRAIEHARGDVYERAHFHKLPGAGKLRSIDSAPRHIDRSAPSSLFDFPQTVEMSDAA